MKKLILLELALLFLATTFQSDNPPGWYQQQLPVSDFINDIFFLDSLNGWVVTAGASSSTDTGYIMQTTNGGTNWIIQYSQIINFNTIQFIDSNTGYAGGGTGFGKLLKTTNGGGNWSVIASFGFISVVDLFFVNNDTGWVCDDNSFNGGLYKTTNGGGSWQEQLNETYKPLKIFFINKDTGWVGNGDANGKLYRTINAGLNWNLQFNFTGGLIDIFFASKDSGWVTGGGGGTGIMRSINGGNSWFSTNNPTPFGNAKIFFYGNKRGWVGSGFNVIVATLDGENWGYQNTPAGNHYSVFFSDSLKGWAGGSDLIHTLDGGGPIVEIKQTGIEIPTEFKLYQNYPNPFNPITNFKLQITNSSNVKLLIYDVSGKLISTVINQKLSPGVYEENFDGSYLSSGVYFYSLLIDGSIVDTKKMLLVK